VQTTSSAQTARSDHEREFERLFGDGSVQARMEIYLRLFYSPTFAAVAESALAAPAPAPSAGPAAVLGCLELVDFRRLQVEQRGRVAQLERQLRKHCQALWAYLLEDEITALVGRFADAPEFWVPRGRSGTENFCLHAHSEFERSGRPFLADLVQLLGVISGLTAFTQKPSPWQNRRAAPEPPSGQVLASEAFVARFPLLDAAGRIRREPPEPGPGETPNGLLTFVWTFADRSSVVGSTDDDAQGESV
jgi:hypothetical protein